MNISDISTTSENIINNLDGTYSILNSWKKVPANKKFNSFEEAYNATEQVVVAGRKTGIVSSFNSEKGFVKFEGDSFFDQPKLLVEGQTVEVGTECTLEFAGQSEQGLNCWTVA